MHARVVIRPFRTRSLTCCAKYVDRCGFGDGAKNVVVHVVPNAATNPIALLPNVDGEQAREDKELLGPELFLDVQKICFRQIFQYTFQELKKNHGSR